jgi:hypothetical protein
VRTAGDRLRRLPLAREPKLLCPCRAAKPLLLFYAFVCKFSDFFVSNKYISGKNTTKPEKLHTKTINLTFLYNKT